MTMAHFRLVVLAGGLIVAAGCGGDGGGGGTCEMFAACGGDVVGSWAVQSMCARATVQNDDCEGMTTDLVLDKGSGTVTYNADKTYTSETTLGGRTIVHMPSACLMFEKIKVTCAQLTEASKDEFLDSGDFESFSCAAEGQGCACTGVLKPGKSQETGTYAITGNTITTTAGGEEDASDYCVAGTTMRQKPPASLMMGMDGNSITGAIVLKKK